MKNLDTIDVICGNETFECGTIVDYISLVLNGEVVKGTFDSMTFVCASDMKQGMLELMTCSCGVSGCAGIFDGTQVKRRRYTTEWRDVDCGFPKKFYSFLNTQYNEVVSKTLQYLYDIALLREGRVLAQDDDYYGVLSFRDTEELDIDIAYRKNWLNNHHRK